MFSPDLTKMFDPQNMSQNWAQNLTKSWQQMFDFNSAASSSKTTAESYKQLSSICADTYSTCCEKQLKLCQSTMENSVEAMRDLSTAKGIEDYMSKQAEWSRKITEKCQTGAQDIASTVQTGQAQCNDIITKLMSQTTDAATSSMQNATNAATNTTRSSK